MSNIALLITAVLTGVAGIITALASLHSARRETRNAAAKECNEQITGLRAESEQYAREVHRMHMLHPDEIPPA